MARRTSKNALGTRIFQSVEKEYGFKGHCFHAVDQDDADRKMGGWNRYHSFTNNPGCGWHIAVEVTQEQAFSIHDEWMS